MTKHSKSSNVLAFVTVAILLLAERSNAKPVCDDDSWGQLKASCGEYVSKGKPVTFPSPQCCRTIKNANLPCACKKVTPPIEETISVPLAITMASFCGHPVPPGTKCGNITVPAP